MLQPLVAGEEREVLGRCVAGLQLTAQRQRLPEDPRDRGAWLLDFRRATSGGAATSAATSAARLEDSCFNEGDMVIIGVEGTAISSLSTANLCMLQKLCSRYKRNEASPKRVDFCSRYRQRPAEAP